MRVYFKKENCYALCLKWKEESVAQLVCEEKLSVDEPVMHTLAPAEGGARCLSRGGSQPHPPSRTPTRGSSPQHENCLFAAFFSAALMWQPTPPSPPCPWSPPPRHTPQHAPHTNLAAKNSRGHLRLPAVAPPALFCWRPRAQLMVGRRPACLSLSLLLIARRICASQFLWGEGGSCWPGCKGSLGYEMSAGAPRQGWQTIGGDIFVSKKIVCYPCWRDSVMQRCVTII